MATKKAMAHSKKISGLIYEPKMKFPPLMCDLFDMGEVYRLHRKIDEAVLGDREMEIFLKSAAFRFAKFRYDLIAEKYAHSTENVKELFRELLLVIPDVDDAIRNGASEMTDELTEYVEGAISESEGNESGNDE